MLTLAPVEDHENSFYLSLALPLFNLGFVVWPVNHKKMGAYCWNSLAYGADEHLQRCVAREHISENAFSVRCTQTDSWRWKLEAQA